MPRSTTLMRTAIATDFGVVIASPAVAAGPDAKILECAKAYKQPALDFLKTMVDQDSGSGDEAGLNKVADMAIAELGRAADGLVVFRKGSGKAYVTVKGKSAHAGVAPEKGRNAATELAHQAIEVGKLGDKEKGTTVNVTVLKAGTASNIIPEDAEATFDVRAAVTDEFDRVERDLKAAAETKLVGETTVTTRLERNFPPMAKNPETDALAERAQAIYGELGKKLTLEGSGGAADASIAAGAGTPTIDGLCIVGGEIHTPNEYAEVESVAPRLYLLTRLMMEVGAGK